MKAMLTKGIKEVLAAVLTAALSVISISALSFPANAAGKAKNPYASYKQLDMSNFKKAKVIYGLDDSGGRSDIFSDQVEKSSIQKRDRMGTPYVTLGGTALLYAEGVVSLSELKRVLMNSNKYVIGTDGHYIVTGVYEHSEISYTRKPTSSFSEAKSQNASIISYIYKKGFVNNPCSKYTTYSDGYLCTKTLEGGDLAKRGYVRAVVFTLKKISSY